MLDEVWYVDIDDAVREARLVRRHQQFGRSAEEARAWVESTDAPNARLIAATRVRAHHVLPWS
jgi:pantothenate kinase